MASFRMLLDAFAGSRPLLALMTPPSDTRLLAQSALERYSCTFCVDSESSNARDDLAATGDDRTLGRPPASNGGIRKAQMSPSSATVPPASVTKPS